MFVLLLTDTSDRTDFLVGLSMMGLVAALVIVVEVHTRAVI